MKRSGNIRFEREQDASSRARTQPRLLPPETYQQKSDHVEPSRHCYVIFCYPPALVGIILNLGLHSAMTGEQTQRLARSIQADGLQVLIAMNPTFFAVDADF